MGSTGVMKANCGWVVGGKGSKEGDQVHSGTNSGRHKEKCKRGRKTEKEKKSKVFHTMQIEMTCRGKNGQLGVRME